MPDSSSARSRRDLTISWQMPDPPVAPTSSHAFPAEASEMAADEASRAAESANAASPAAQGFIHHAFRHKLSRFTAWEPHPDWDEEAAEAFRIAASIYKRGVSTTDQEKRPKRSGRYTIEQIPLDNWAASVFPVFEGKAPFIVVDANVCRYWPLPMFAEAIVIHDVSEQKKQLSLVDTLLSQNAGEKRPWIIVGGGILCDTAAFAADLAGCPFTLVPTTLLAMADACVGGKTGVNFPPYGKNQLGRFAFPARVVCCPEFLGSLPARELRSGLAECIKHAILAGNEPLMERLLELGQVGRYGMIKRDLLTIINVKAQVVTKDPGEAGLRATLNLGHTLGHAIEALGQDMLSRSPGNDDAVINHGEAVYYGMVFTAILSERLTGLSSETKDRIIAACRTCLPSLGVPALLAGTGCKDPGDELLDALFAKISTDKKNTGARGTSNWVLLASLGRCATDEDGGYTIEVPHSHVIGAWPEFIETMTP